VTFIEYSNILCEKSLGKKEAKEIKQQKKGKARTKRLNELLIP
jgi:hypothetical protein